MGPRVWCNPLRREVWQGPSRASYCRWPCCSGVSAELINQSTYRKATVLTQFSELPFLFSSGCEFTTGRGAVGTSGWQLAGMAL